MPKNVCLTLAEVIECIGEPDDVIYYASDEAARAFT